jgi:hypothetical protein
MEPWPLIMKGLDGKSLSLSSHQFVSNKMKSIVLRKPFEPLTSSKIDACGDSGW